MKRPRLQQNDICRLLYDAWPAAGYLEDTGGFTLGLKKTATYQITSGKAYLRSGQAQRAVDIFENVALTNTDNIAVLRHLMHGYLLTGNQRKYQATLEKIDRLTPNDYDNQYELAKLYISTGKFNLAEKMLRAINPENPEQTLQKRILQATLEINRGKFRAAEKSCSP